MWTALCLMSVIALSEPERVAPVSVTVFDRVAIDYDADLPDPTQRDGNIFRSDGQTAEISLDLPPAPDNQRDARRIVATVNVQPRLVRSETGYRPGDPWPRLGTVSIMEGENEVEIMRFITPFGGAATYRADLTALAPYLHGQRTLRLYISTYMETGWEATLTLDYSDAAGQRRPVFAEALFNEEMVTNENNILRARVTIPEGLDRPRIRILSTGHATDGSGGDEFISRTHVLRVDGREIARWRPWMERGGTLRDQNPASGRITIDGRELWSSDFDRSGWNPGAVVWPIIVPAPELTPGEHEVVIEIFGIRPPDENDQRGYWRTSAIIVADEPWPE